MPDQVGAFSDILREMLRSQVKRIEVHTSFYSFPIDDPFKPEAKGPSAVMDAVRPEIHLISATGERIVVAPWGRAEERELAVKTGAAVAGLGILGLLIYGYTR